MRLLLILLITGGTTASKWNTQFLMTQETREAVEEIVNQVLKSKGKPAEIVSHNGLADIVNQQGLEISNLRTEVKIFQERNQELELKLKAVQQENTNIKKITLTHVKQMSEMKKILYEQDKYTSVMRNKIVWLKNNLVSQNRKIKNLEKKLMKGILSELTHTSSDKSAEEINSTTDLIMETRHLKQMHQPVGSKNCDRNKNGSISPKVTGPHLKTAKPRAVAGRGTAFSAYANRFVPHLAAGHLLKCDHTIINDGGGYHGHTGIFTVPTSGVYLLSFTVATSYEDKWLWIKLVVDDRMIVRAATDAQYDDHVEMGGNTAIVRLNQGESVWLEVEKSNDSEIWRVTYTTTFSGVLLYQ